MQNVRTELRDGILFLTIDRPKVLNALNAAWIVIVVQRLPVRS